MTRHNAGPANGMHPFADLIGLKITRWDKGYSQCVLQVREDLMNPHKVLHGGVVYAMADTGMGLALYTTLDQGEMCATVEIKTSYFGAVSSGQLTCETRLIHKGRKIAALESEVRNDDRLVAKALGTYYIFAGPSGADGTP